MELTNSKNNLKFSEITLTSNFLFDIISIIKQTLIGFYVEWKVNL